MAHHQQNTVRTISACWPSSKPGIELIVQDLFADLAPDSRGELRVSLSNNSLIDASNPEHEAVLDDLGALRDPRDKILAALALGTVMRVSRNNREHALQLCLPDGTECNPKAYYIDCAQGVEGETDNRRFVDLNLLVCERPYIYPRKDGEKPGHYKQTVITESGRRIVLIGYVPDSAQDFETGRAITSPAEAEKAFVAILVNVEEIALELVARVNEIQQLFTNATYQVRHLPVRDRAPQQREPAKALQANQPASSAPETAPTVASEPVPVLTLPSAPPIGTNLGAQLMNRPTFVMPKMGDPIEGKPNKRHNERSLADLRKKMKKTHLVMDAPDSTPHSAPAESSMSEQPAAN